MIQEAVLTASSGGSGGGGNASAAQPLDPSAQLFILGAVALGLIILAYLYGNMAVIYSED